MKRPALYIHGRIVEGSSHSAAFEQLSLDERQEDCISSGVFDTETGEFQGYIEEEHFFRKEILLMRHANVINNGPDPGISRDGINQILAVIPYLRRLDLGQFICKCSPMLRCLETANVIQSCINVKFSVDASLVEAPPSLKQDENYYLPARCAGFPQYLWPDTNGWLIKKFTASDFINRVADVLRSLPQKSILISHSGFVIGMARLALCENTMLKCGIPTASLTHIENREVRCLGRAT
jgi:broad specificity phosphatase PhoE